MPDSGFRPTPLDQILAPRRTRARTMEYRRRPGERKPLWAILGEPPPLGWDPPESRDIRAVKLAAAEQPDDGGRFADELVEGAGSWVRGIGRAGDHLLDSIGATNAQDEVAAWRANRIAWNALRQVIAHPREALEIVKKPLRAPGNMPLHARASLLGASRPAWPLEPSQAVRLQGV